jgi:hypothetical protein
VEGDAKTVSMWGTAVKQLGGVLENIHSLFAGNIPNCASSSE